jgi:Na+/H+-translocating membrane pyrophosphatase
VLWATAIAAGVGILLGSKLRVPALLAVCLVIVVAWIVAAMFTGSPMLTVLGSIVGALCALQCGYLAGLSASCAWLRVRSSSRPTVPITHPVTER